MVLEWGNESTGEQPPDDYALQPGDEGHRKTITPYHGVIEDPGEHGYRHVAVRLDEHDPSHDHDDPYDKTRPLTDYFRR